MLDVGLRTQDYIRHNLIADHPMGLPKEGWHIRVDLQNVHEAAWLGASLRFPAQNCPYDVPGGWRTYSLTHKTAAGNTTIPLTKRRK